MLVIPGQPSTSSLDEYAAPKPPPCSCVHRCKPCATTCTASLHSSSSRASPTAPSSSAPEAAARHWCAGAHVQQQTMQPNNTLTRLWNAPCTASAPPTTQTHTTPPLPSSACLASSTPTNAACAATCHASSACVYAAASDALVITSHHLPRVFGFDFVKHASFDSNILFVQELMTQLHRCVCGHAGKYLVPTCILAAQRSQVGHLCDGRI